MLKKVFKNEFNRNVLTLVLGTTLAQAIPILISPILTRLYTPSDYGVLALFVAITAILGSISTARYELAITLPKDDEDAINIAALSVVIAFIISSILLLIFLLFGDQISEFLGNKKIKVWLYFSPLVIFFMGFYNALTVYNTRTKDFKLISQVNVIKSISMSSVQILLGLLKAGVSGLIIGQIVSHVFTNFRLAKKHITRDKIRNISMKKIKFFSKRYVSFPKYSLWAVLANNMSHHLNSVFISMLYSTSSLGLFSLINRVLGMPSTVLGDSIGKVFYQKASEEKRVSGSTKKTFNETFKKMLIISLPPFIILYFIMEDLIAFVFGPEWSLAGTYGIILLPMFFLRFIIKPFSYITTIFEKNHVELILQVINLSIIIIMFFVAMSYQFNITIFLQLLSTLVSIFTIIRLFIYKVISNG